jgi:hypothetical protein
MEVSFKLYAPATLCPEKELAVHIGWVGLRTILGAVKKRKFS